MRIRQQHCLAARARHVYARLNGMCTLRSFRFRLGRHDVDQGQATRRRRALNCSLLESRRWRPAAHVDGHPQNGPLDIRPQYGFINRVSQKGRRLLVIGVCCDRVLFYELRLLRGTPGSTAANGMTMKGESSGKGIIAFQSKAFYPENFKQHTGTPMKHNPTYY